MMYKYFLFLFITAFCSEIICQPENPVPAEDDTTYYIIVEEMPEPTEGISGIQSRIYYTEEALNAKIEGKVYVLAYLNEEGSVVKTKVIKGLGYGLDEIVSEAVLQTKFTPGKQNGIPVKVQIVIPIIFKLE